MRCTPDPAAALIANLTAWALARDDIRAALIFGSRARAEHPADAWSDVDALILARDPGPLWRDTGWLAHLGTVALHFGEPTPDAQGREVRALFEGGLDVDLVLAPTAAASGAAAWFYAELLAGGVRTLVDKDGLLAGLLALVPPERDGWPVAEETFANLVSDFWFHTVWTAKKIRRGDLWSAKSCCDGYLKQRLLTMLEWHARARGRSAEQVGFGGRFMAEWADPEAVAALADAYGHYDVADVWRALGVTADLFCRVARQVAQALGHAYPAAEEARALALVAHLQGAS